MKSNLYQIYDTIKDAYFSIGIDGKHKWLFSPEMAYTYSKDEAETLLKLLIKDWKYTDIIIVEYKKY